MRPPFKSSLASRVAARSLIVACMPAAAIAFAAHSPALGAAFGPAANRDLTVDDNASAGTNGAPTHVPETNNSGTATHGNQAPGYPLNGIRG